LFRSGDIRDRSAKSSEIVPKIMFSVPFFGGEDPQILNLVFKNAPISDHVAKFRGDRPRDRDLALKKRKKETAAKHIGSRVVLPQRAALISSDVNKTDVKIKTSCSIKCFYVTGTQ